MLPDAHWHTYALPQMNYRNLSKQCILYKLRSARMFVLVAQQQQAATVNKAIAADETSVLNAGIAKLQQQVW
jgi:hypothetical protein